MKILRILRDLWWTLSVGARPFGTAAQVAAPEIACDEQGITIVQPGGVRQSIRWDQITGISIHTLDTGPLAPDLYWIFEHAGTVTTFPGGDSALIGELPKYISNANMEQVLAAMGSTSNARFVIWPSPD